MGRAMTAASTALAAIAAPTPVATCSTQPSNRQVWSVSAAAKAPTPTKTVWPKL